MFLLLVPLRSHSGAALLTSSKVFHFVFVCVEYVYVIVAVACLLPLLLYSVSSAPGSGFNVAGRIESGHIQLGESVLVLPANETASIKGETRF